MSAITTIYTMPKFPLPLGVSRAWNMAKFEGFRSTIYPATLESPLGRKRSYEASGMNDEDLAFCFQPSKRTRSRPQHGVESKSSRFVLTSVSGGTIFPIASTRRFLQATKPSSQLTPSNDRGQLTGAMGSRRKTTRKAVLLACDFTIHQDTPEEEMANLLVHSANRLDISDNEIRLEAKIDRGKENVPPADAVAGPVAKRATDGLRAPLRNLDVAEFYDL